MIPELDTNTGLLPPGCHDCCIQEFKEKFVDNFPNSKSRNNRFEGYIEYCKFISKNVKSTKIQIIDGSFTTNELNPKDIDFVIFINNSKVTKAEQRFIQREILKLREKKRLRHSMSLLLSEGFVSINDLPCCDCFFVFKRDPDDEEYDDYVGEKEYWLDCFGHTRKNKSGKRKPKGFINLTMNSATFEGV